MEKKRRKNEKKSVSEMGKRKKWRWNGHRREQGREALEESKWIEKWGKWICL